MSELRFHPLIRDWVMIASHRQNRPQMPRDYCPFCPGSGRVPEDYDVLKYDNDFPTLSQPPDEVPDVSPFYRNAEAYGKCEVILYSPNHHASLPELSQVHVEKLVRLWRDRFAELSKDERIKYIFIFENRGEVVGVTMPHPHGQIYAYPFIPKKLELELASSLEYNEAHGRCLICDMLAEEKRDGRRVIFENNDFSVVLPYFCEYPYGVYIISKNHFQNLTQFSDGELASLADVLRTSVGTLDCLFDMDFPYMMCMHQAPANSGDTTHYHFHIEFFTPLRARDKIKFNASSETGAWAHCNPTSPEEKAEELRQAHGRFISK